MWRPGLELGQPSSLAGYGIAENEQMPDIAADAKAIAFGNFKRGYTIVDRIGTRILRDPYTNKPFVGFYTTKRTGGMLVSVEDDESTFGRRVQVHEYPNRDKPWTEDLGRATRRLTINAYLVGDDYADRRDRLISAIETAGPGTLVHPQYGEMQGSIDGQVRITHSSTEGRMCRVSFQFVESGELSFPVAGMATAKRLETSGGLFDDAIDSMFSTFSLSGISDFIQNDVIADAASMLGDVADAFRMVDSGVSAAMRLLQGDLSVILMPPSAASDFVNALQKAWRSGDRLRGSTSDLVTMIKTMSGITLDPGLSPRGTWPTDSGSAAKQKMQRNMIAAAITRYRPHTIQQSGTATTDSCKSRCEFEARQRAAKTLETTYTVQGWRQGNGELWKPNQAVVVYDPLNGFDNETLVIAEVTYSQDNNGTLTEIRVGPADAYLPEPFRPKAKKKVSEEADF
ncbi:phage major capsid protein [Salmonella enterica]|uniref:Phage major capsid protein n=10 Tax=Salmonella enterica TaxID=28901 RepID=A0A724DV61_SALEN|nr:phage major capsid protein [Salmonella enterica]EBF8113104.1 phage major capsid protein [Salmonella enterica subsp. enterica serovar Enteritidis]ECQ1882818.1 phage major capsid protein [Salmonella enterica subsp. enterica]EDR0765096.1 phage major capsid protein [Salmonella enterica subsp. enterica serovar Thompson]EAB3833081.1 phage major capsid protein [Salmonella enterica]